MRAWRKAALILTTLAGGWVGANLLLSDGPCAATASGECGKPVPVRVDLPLDPITWQLDRQRAFQAPAPAAAKRWKLEDGVVKRREGQGWHTVTLPHVPVPDQRAKVVVSDLAVAGPDDVWVVGDVTTHLCCMSFSHHREVVMRWDGSTWHLLDLGLRGVELTDAAIDRRGGLWIAAQGIAEDVALLLHHDRGRWTRAALPLPTGISRVEDLTFERDHLKAGHSQGPHQGTHLPEAVTWGSSR